MQRTRFVLFSLLLSVAAFAQVNLGPPINNGILPGNSTSIDPITPYFDTTNLYITSGFPVADTVADFTLFDTSGTAFQLSAALANGKPKVLVTVSLSCPASRHSMVYVMPDLLAMFGTSVDFVLVYVVEAHPVTPFLSPYSNTVWTTQQNINDSILIPQEGTYLERKQYAASFANRYPNAAKLLVDDPQNNYWMNFGPAPNNAYLIAPNGTVYRKYGWFDQSKVPLINDIQHLLVITQTNEATDVTTAIYPNPSNGNFQIQTNYHSEWSLNIMDMQGRVVAHRENIGTNDFLLSENLLPGIYFVNTGNGEQESHSRIVVSGN